SAKHCCLRHCWLRIPSACTADSGRCPCGRSSALSPLAGVVTEKAARRSVLFPNWNGYDSLTVMGSVLTARTSAQGIVDVISRFHSLTPQKGEQTAQACANACSRQFSMWICIFGILCGTLDALFVARKCQLNSTGAGNRGSVPGVPGSSSSRKHTVGSRNCVSSECPC